VRSRKRYEIVYDSEVAGHLKPIERKYYSLIERTIERQLGHGPDKESRNRKPLLRPTGFGEAWELRFGPDNRFRVFYSVDTELREVHILAIGVKLGNQLFIGGKRFNL
jgi:mRNA-degrading endonuclease RelE of RelBE toxin-antitoxin system